MHATRSVAHDAQMIHSINSLADEDPSQLSDAELIIAARFAPPTVRLMVTLSERLLARTQFDDLDDCMFHVQHLLDAEAYGF